jgi:hypothetical protein
MGDELYKLARERIDRRNRQLFLLGANVLAMFIYLAAFTAFRSLIPPTIGVFIAVAWIGVVACHAMAYGVLQNRSAQIDAEVERLRRQVYDEKPKHVELNDDGELVEAPEEMPRYDHLSADKKRGDGL